MEHNRSEIYPDQHGVKTAGLVLAARLSEDSETSVLVLEAGGANINDPAIRAHLFLRRSIPYQSPLLYAILVRPASYGSHFGQPQYDWSHKTVWR